MKPSWPARLRDLLLLVVTCCCALLATILVAGRIWFAALFESALRFHTLLAASALGAVALAAGIAFVLTGGCPEPPDRRIK